MISKDEVVRLAKSRGVKPWQQEKHYIQALCLNALSETSLVFKGGTYLWFFAGLNRFSEDLDFTAKEGNFEHIYDLVSQKLNEYGIDNKILKITNNERSISFRVAAHGPLYDSDVSTCYLYIEISKREKILLSTVSLNLDFPEYNIPVKTLSGMNLEETACEKVRAVLKRNKARDVFDLTYLIEKKNVNFNEELINKKLEYYNIKYDKKTFENALKHKEENWNELNSLTFKKPSDFTHCKNVILKWARN